MKKPYFYLNIFVAIVATMLAACNVGDIDISIVPNTPTVTTLNFSSNMESDESARTAYYGETIVWSEGDKIRMAYTVNDIWQNATGNSDGKAKFYESNQANTNKECTRATFSVPGHFESNNVGTHRFYVLYPSRSAVTSPDIEAPYADVKINNTQTASATTFDKDADIMIGRSVESYEALPTKDEQIRLVWNRLVAHGFITLTNLDAVGESVNSVTLTAANGTKLTGTYPINITNGEIDEAKEAHNNVTLQFSETTIGDDKKLPFWFCSLPFETNYIKVEVDTEHYTFCREITLDGRTLNFQQNKRNTLAINMKDVVPTAKTAGVNATDVIDCPFTGVTTTSYTDWTNTSISSGATYKGQSATKSKNQEYVQLKSKDSTSGIVTTKSAGKVTKIVISWNEGTSNDRVLSIYGKNSAYSAATDLYNANTQGDHLGDVALGTTEFIIEGDYAFIGLRSKSGALYLNYVQIVWGDGGETPAPVQLTMSDITCSAQTETSLTFSWSAVANATGYKVSTDNSNWIDANGNLSHTLSDLTAGTEYTLYVKAIGNGSTYTDSTAKSASGTTSAAQGGGEGGSSVFILTGENMAAMTNSGTGYNTEKTYTDGTYTWVTNGYQDGTTKNMIQLRVRTNNSGVSWIKLPNFPAPIKDIKCSVTSASAKSEGADQTSNRLYYQATNAKDADYESFGGTATNEIVMDLSGFSYTTGYITANGGIRIWNITVTLQGEGGGETPAPVQLTMSNVTCSAQTENSLTFSWEAVANATGYQVSTDGGTNYGATQTATTYTWTGLTASTTKTIYVKAIGNGSTYTDSAAKSANGTTSAAQGGGEGGSSEPITKTINLTGGSGTNGASWNFTSSPVTCTVVTNGNSTAPRLDSNLLRMYASNGKSNLMTITTNSSPKKKVTKVIVYCTSSDYATALNNGAATVDSGASVSKSKSGNNVVYTITGNTESISITTGGQARMNKIDVTYTD